ncbi:DUF402 domain-containing protein [Desertihabitans brevis]|uniref:DUF402 domain-containing protein n=1 Tax=Desertihabitans brevis TaxID=2268447 RepID=A0A367YY14_9ACTN|nr:DUF402 domain-containing protein [Desertihabitans brevis]RCK70419.1 DUF402 domain-containing protein [Desertihabitans brevis]
MSWPEDARPGEPVLTRCTKWPGSPHWQREGVWLGTDAHGAWLGRPAGARSWRPGADYRNTLDGVALVPAGATDWVASLARPADPAAVEVYVDLMWDVRWSAEQRGVLLATDMDLDVVRTADGHTFLDDEDEFAAHSARWDYPEDVGRQVRDRAERLLADVRRGTPPFDGSTATGWLDRLARLG